MLNFLSSNKNTNIELKIEEYYYYNKIYWDFNKINENDTKEYFSAKRYPIKKCYRRLLPLIESLKLDLNRYNKFLKVGTEYWSEVCGGGVSKVVSNLDRILGKTVIDKKSFGQLTDEIRLLYKQIIQKLSILEEYSSGIIELHHCITYIFPKELKKIEQMFESMGVPWNVAQKILNYQSDKKKLSKQVYQLYKTGNYSSASQEIRSFLRAKEDCFYGVYQTANKLWMERTSSN